jgi:hypothetical protein
VTKAFMAAQQTGFQMPSLSIRRAAARVSRCKDMFPGRAGQSLLPFAALPSSAISLPHERTTPPHSRRR